MRERGGGGRRVADAGCFMKQTVVVGGIDESARRTPQWRPAIDSVGWLVGWYRDVCESHNGSGSCGLFRISVMVGG